MSSTAWLAIFMLLALKIPLVYLGLVIWWAVREGPASPGEADDGGEPVLEPLTPCNWGNWKQRRVAALRTRFPVRPGPGGLTRPNVRRRHADVE